MNFVAEQERGFTMIELIISIFILCTAIVGAASAFSIMNTLTADIVDRLTATYLSQEGMEIIRNVRDTNWLSMDASFPVIATWVDGLDCALGCEADYTSTGITPGFSRYLNIDSNNFYGYNSGTPTKFKRKITITPITDVDGDASHIIKVVVQVFWDGKPNILDLNPNSHPEKYSIISEGTLYNWYNYINQ